MPVTTEVTTVTPEMAMGILESNVNNRNVRKTRVDSYARDMKAGKWHLNGDPIRFNGKGALLDGQHRLLACIMANKPFDTIVIRGLKDDAHATIDVGAGRTLGDELKWRGYKDANNLASALTLVWLYDNGLVTKAASATRADALAVLAKDPTFPDHLNHSVHVAKKIGIQISPFTASAYILRREHGDEVTDVFLNHLEAGTDYMEGDPCLTLRNYILATRSKSHFRPTRYDWFAMVLKTMNAHLLGRPLKVLKWKRVGPNAEAFPTLVGKGDLE